MATKKATKKAKKSAKKAKKASGAKKAKKAKKAGAKKGSKKKASAKKAKKAGAKKAGAKKSSKKKAKKAGAKRDSKKKSAEKGKKKSSKSGGAAAEAERILAEENPAAAVAEQCELLLDSRRTVATKAARVVHEIVNEKPELLVSHVEKFARGLTVKPKRVIQASADALPAIAKISPARVAKHLPTLKEAFEPTLADGKDGLVRTFANLCTASVAYQKRLEPILTHALEGANGKTLLRWSEIVLPALKGEPHARARSVVEDRLDRIPRSIAQQIANNLGFKLRVRYR
jgi:hypothetical protein